jgi:inorganic triphosphatase YgiF
LKAVKRGLKPLVTTDVERTTVPLVFPDGTAAFLAIDIGEIRVEGAEALPISEVEIELEDGDVEPLYRFAQTLATEHPLTLEPKSKAERGFTLLHPTVAEPERARDAALDKKTSAADAMAAILRACARQIEGNADGLVADDDPEWVHQMRIGTRRLRACLAMLRDFVPADLLAPVAADARWLARTLGPARDLDVLVLETLPLIFKALREGSDDAIHTPLNTFSERAMQRRAEARAAARSAVTSQRFVQLILGVGALAATPRLGAPEGSPTAIALARPARALAQPLLKRRYRKLMKRGENLPHVPAEARHAARLAAKRLRYATEFFAVLFSRKRTRVFRDSLTRLQDVLGTMNDAEVAAQLAAEVVGAGSTSAAMLRGWAAASTSTQTAALARGWKSFQRTPTFWDRS